MHEFLKCQNSYMQKIWPTETYSEINVVEAKNLQTNFDQLWWKVREELFDFINEEALV